MGVVIGLAIVGSFVLEMVQKVEPDYQIAYTGSYALPFGMEEQIQELLEGIADDRNGDGQVSVQINSYAINEEDPTAYASQVSLVGDITIGSSEFFLVADPMAVQEQYGIFYLEDGSLAQDERQLTSCMSYAWSECEALSSLDLGMETELYLVRRGYVDEEMREEHAGSDVFWEAMTGGAEMK